MLLFIIRMGLFNGLMLPHILSKFPQLRAGLMFPWREALEVMEVSIWSSTYCSSESKEENINLLGSGTNKKIIYRNLEYVLLIRKLLMSRKINSIGKTSIIVPRSLERFPTLYLSLVSQVLEDILGTDILIRNTIHNHCGKLLTQNLGS